MAGAEVGNSNGYLGLVINGSPIPILDIKDIFGGFTDDAFAGPAIEDSLALSGDFRTNACRRFGAWSALAVVGKHHDGDDGGGKKENRGALAYGRWRRQRHSAGQGQTRDERYQSPHGRCLLDSLNKSNITINSVLLDCLSEMQFEQSVNLPCDLPIRPASQFLIIKQHLYRPALVLVGALSAWANLSALAK